MLSVSGPLLWFAVGQRYPYGVNGKLRQ
ncbi:hypothetical protein [Rhodococcoides corynebacterioides]